MKEKKLKGFTLIEVMVVVFIILILCGILVPSIFNLYRGSRIKTANSNAKIVFNAAQTIAQRYQVEERARGIDVLEGGKDKVSFVCQNGVLVSSYANGVAISGAGRAEAQNFCDRVNNIYADGPSTTWSVYIDEYIVKLCLCADNIGNSYVGRFPVPTTDDDIGSIEFNSDAASKGCWELSEKNIVDSGYSWHKED